MFLKFTFSFADESKPPASNHSHKNSVLLECWVTTFIVSTTDSLQVSHGLLPVQHLGQLLLVAGGGHVPTDPAGPDICLSEEVLLVVHPNWMG